MQGIAHLLELGALLTVLWPRPETCQMGSLAGAAHLLNNNADVLR